MAYLFMATGIFEFSGITIALLLAVRRTRGGQAPAARVYRTWPGPPSWGTRCWAWPTC